MRIALLLEEVTCLGYKIGIFCPFCDPLEGARSPKYSHLPSQCGKLASSPDKSPGKQKSRLLHHTVRLHPGYPTKDFPQLC